MKYYNRDNYERNLESYEVPEYFSKGSRNVFVYGFIVGAVIGSAIGLVTLSKPRNDKYSDKQSKEDQFKSSIINQTEADQRAAEEQVADIKASINNQESVSAAELAAQKDAIKEEVAEHHLADTSPNAQQSQQDVSATQKSSDEESNVAELETKHIDASKEPSQSEVAAQQEAIKDETQSTSDNHASASSQSETSSDHNGAKIAAATGGTVAAAGIAKAAADKNDKIDNDEETANRTDELVSEDKKSTSTEPQETPNLVTESKSETTQSTGTTKASAVAVGTVTAAGLASAAKSKQTLIQNDTNVADNTANLLTPEGIKANNKTEFPNLVTESNVETSVESTDKVDNTADKGNKAATATSASKPHDAERRVEQVHETVSFKDGIITHDKAGQNGNKSTSTSASTASTQSEEQVDYNEGIISHGTANKQTDEDANNSTYTKNRPQAKKAEKAKSKIAKRTFND
ncbi:hypothetical protein NQ035_00685 [Staphylococcus gallinarum]|uniref:hypothetical protein n=1 Tax=Staphylococcus gallinarum TaxID=1293 RepID=UPI000D1DF84F|nr:hypothetical protein [Staphylococcus gallinarum]MCD8819876.1 hypothetical protein [Staphylococcus gallinarum]MCQ9287371.1 hypothetical protein [Staphylococcus gallinarum]PTL07326.1 hypothetical protein BUZ09_08825 [Staphylococcus gallinarum]PTL10203.1 hypothetical protein BUZ15_05575 [Staphylococcus gallinarum]RIL33068.1 hypothetical protein BUY98_08785 [Staphylococcus gallinarum]